MIYFESKIKSLAGSKFLLFLQLCLWALFLGSKEVAVVLGGVFLVSIGVIHFKEDRLGHKFNRILLLNQSDKIPYYYGCNFSHLRCCD
jgi:hypothetical protein